MNYLLILFMLLCSPAMASEAQTVINNAVINGQFMQKTGFNSLFFDGATGLSQNDIVSIPAGGGNQIVGMTNGFSIEAMILAQSSGESNGRIVTKGNGTTTGYYVNIANQAGNSIAVSALFGRATTAALTTTQTNLARSTWLHVIVTFDLVNPPIIYINGTSASTTGTPTAGSGNIGDDSADIMYIGNNSVLGRTFDGYIGRFRTYANKVLSPTEVLALYNSGTFIQNQHQSLATGEWNLIDGKGLILTDTSIYANNGALADSPSTPIWTNISN